MTSTTDSDDAPQPEADESPETLPPAEASGDVATAVDDAADDVIPAAGDADEAASPVAIADPVLLNARDLALAALHEITPATSVGEPADYRLEADGVVSLRFENTLAGYPGWFWTVSLARLDDAEPTVLEVELLPGEGALLAPDWVPWTERLADYQAAQAALAEIVIDEVDADDTDVDLDDVDDLDAADFDNDGSPILHAGDVDGVDIDELDDSGDDDEFDEDDSDDDESEVGDFDLEDDDVEDDDVEDDDESED